MEYTAFVVPSNDGGFIIKCLEVPITSQGGTKEEALTNIKEAIDGYLEARANIDHKKYSSQEIVVKVITEESIINELSVIQITEREKEVLKRSIKEMKEGNFVRLQEL